MSNSLIYLWVSWVNISLLSNSEQMQNEWVWDSGVLIFHILIQAFIIPLYLPDKKLLLQTKAFTQLLWPMKTCWGDMHGPCVDVMQILLHLFQLLFLGNIVNARQIKLWTKWEHLRALGSAAHDKRKNTTKL